MAILKAHNSFLRANGKILVKPEGDGDSVVIGGRKYPIVKIGNQLWMAENLDWKWDGLTFYSYAWRGQSNMQRCTYYGGGEHPVIEGYGLLYSWDAANYLEQNKSSMLPDGWHLPVAEDYNNTILQMNILEPSSTNTEGLFLKSKTGWDANNGNDFFKFNGKPAGMNNWYTGQYENLGKYTTFWTNDSQSSSRKYGLYLNYDNNNFVYSTLDIWHGMSIRLVKDAT